jgi:hypothetical protein
VVRNICRGFWLGWQPLINKSIGIVNELFQHISMHSIVTRCHLLYLQVLESNREKVVLCEVYDDRC